ncbi:MAG: hypothetical protein HRT73_01475, partial [Flavobacteriales bacterium]|nr:hypothetical protein [Flavobacteriales bacterium]
IVWIGGNGCLSRFDGTNWQNYTMQNSGLPLNLIRSIVLESANNLWIGMAGQGIANFNSTNNSWTHFNANNTNLQNNFVNAITIAPDNKKWLSTENGIAIK